jgi:hypothetical protein
MRHGDLLSFGFAFRRRNDNPLAICSCCSRLLLDSITPHFGLSLHRYHYLSWSRLALPQPFNEAAISSGSASIRRSYTLRSQVGIPAVNNTDYRLIDFSVLRPLPSFTRNTSES